MVAAVAPERSKKEDAPPDPAQAPAVPEMRIRDYFRWRPLPWYLCFFFGIFLLAKLQLVYNDSPCAVLGTTSPVTVADIKKAFRTLSMCTHPDRLRGRLQRQPTAAEERRGEIIFNRASAAKDSLSKVLRLKDGKEVACYQGEMELAVWLFFKQLGLLASNLGVDDFVTFFTDLFWTLVTFESGFFNTVLSLLWFAFMYRMVRQFVVYLWRLGIIRGTVALVTTTIIGPIPTVVHFIVLPFVRVAVFVNDFLADMRPEVEAPPSTSDGKEDDRPSPTNASGPPTMTAGLAVAKDEPNRLRQRRKKESEEEKEAKSKALLTGDAEDTSAATFGAGPMPEGIWSCVSWKHKEQIKARQAAANAVQFDLLLILTKPVIPLFMLIAMGQVMNGLLTSLFIGHALRQWVPKMSHEAQHLLVSFFGMVHTLLGVSAQQVEDFSQREGKKVLHLAWTWTIKDVLQVVNMCQLGATVTVIAALGNEPSFAASFAAGLALRIAVAQDSVRSLGLAKLVGSYIEVTLRDLGVQLDAADEVVAYSGGGIGDCGGGPFRMLLGDGPQARWASVALKVWLMVIPLLSAVMWLQRTVQASRMLGKRWKLTRLVQRLILCTLGLVQCAMIAATELNASNGALINFWVAMLFGCVGESLLSTYDIRGTVRQILFLLLFLVI